MCMYITRKMSTKQSLLAFVLRYTSRQFPGLYLTLKQPRPLVASKVMIGYFEDSLWNPALEKGAFVEEGMLHSIVNLRDAILSYMKDGWMGSFLYNYQCQEDLFDLGIFMVEIPPSIVYCGRHNNCSIRLDSKAGYGTQFYKVVAKIDPYVYDNSKNTGHLIKSNSKKILVLPLCSASEPFTTSICECKINMLKRLIV